MAKIAIIILADTNSTEALSKVSIAFMLANEAVDNSDDLKIIFEGAGTKWIKELEEEDNKLHKLYDRLKGKITGVCSFCARAFGETNNIQKSGIQLLSEYKSHPSLRKIIAEGYYVITF